MALLFWKYAPSVTRDRRVVRSRVRIETAFIDLVLEGSYEQLTIKDIVARAGVAKGTFYAHYRSKDAVLMSTFDRLLVDLKHRMETETNWDAIRAGRERLSAAVVVFRHAYELRDLYCVCLGQWSTRALYRDWVYGMADDVFSNRVATVGNRPRVPLPLLAHAWVGASLAIMDAWLNGAFEATPEEAAQMCLDVQLKGVDWAQGLTDEAG